MALLGAFRLLLLELKCGQGFASRCRYGLVALSPCELRLWLLLLPAILLLDDWHVVPLLNRD